MSVVTNSVHINGAFHDQQLGQTPMTSANQGGIISNVGKEGVPGIPSKPTTNESLVTNNNSHVSTDSNHSVRENGDALVEAEQGEDAPVIDIIINNVVCTFNTRCYLNLKKIAMEGAHVEFRRENGMLNMKLRHPTVTATIWSSGKITCTGSTSEDEAKLGARRIARRLQKLGFNIRFSDYRVVNVLGTCSLPFGIKLNQFSEANMESASYEPELHPGVTYRIKEPKATLKIFSTGSITVTAPCVLNVQLAIEHIYPLVVQYKMDRARIDKKVLLKEQKFLRKGKVYIGYPVLRLRGDGDEDEDESEDELDEEEGDISDDFDSDLSQD